MGRYFFRDQKVGRPSPAHYRKMAGVATMVWTDRDGATHVRYHDTDVVSFNDDWITLRTGGWSTKTTMDRMNRAASMFDLGFGVFAHRGDWYVEFGGKWPFSGNTTSFNRKTHEMVEEDKFERRSGRIDAKRERSGNSRRRVASRNISTPEDVIDVVVRDEGTIVMFELRTDAAKTWWYNSVSEGPSLGGAYAVGHQYADDIINGMLAEGFNVK